VSGEQKQVPLAEVAPAVAATMPPR
jgi:hypothetical protein